MSADSSLAYQYVAPELRVYHGRDSFTALKRELERSKCRRAVIVCGRTIGRSEALASFKGALGELFAGVTTSAREHSPVSGVIETTEALRASRADAVIAIGGGSAAVTARAATIMLAEGKPIADLSTRRLPDGKFESPRLNASKLPIFVVPTTPSTAFAKAGTAVHADDGARLALFDPKTRARSIFIHPDFVGTAPPQLALSATLNAFANAVEALESPKCDPFSEAMLMHSLRLIRANLNAIEDGDVGVRERLVIAAILCGRGTEQGGTALASVLAHAIGHRTHVANGTVNAIVLPHTMRYNAPVTGGRAYATVEPLDASDKSSDAASVVERYLRKLPVPRSLREIGVERDHLREIADAAMADWFITRNPRPVPDVGTLVNLLEAAW